MGFASILRAQQSPSIKGNNTFNYKSSTMSVSGMIGETYMNTRTTLTKSGNEIHIGFPYRFMYSKDAFKDNLQVSKGYYSNYVRLQWELYNPEAVTQIKIFRRLLSEGDDDFRLTATVSSQESSWQDQYAEPGLMYEYKVIADGIWDTEILGLNRVNGVGFRVTSATITGRITYAGGNVVPGVKIVAEPKVDSKEGEYSYNFSDNIYALIRPKNQPNLSEGTSIQTWVKPKLIKNKINYPIFSIGTSLSLGIKHTDDKNFVQVKVGDATKLSQAIPDSIFSEFMQLSLTWEGNSKECIVYLNGDSLIQTDFPQGNVAAANWLIGASLNGENYNYFSGHIDEVKLWSKTLNNEDIFSSFDAYENPNNAALAGYWKFNEGGGKNIYDISRKGNNFNENHGLIVSHSLKYGSYEKTLPSSERLGCKAVTDENGNYVIAGIPFSSGGSYFRVVPSLGVHRFDPTNKLLYISQESSVFNNINFTDQSSFKVTGKVMYKGTNYPVKDVYLKIDGSIVADSKKQPIKTDENGEYTIDVPIGLHYISVEKNGHVFGSSYWPKLDENENPTFFDFQDDLYGRDFSDTTKVKLVGKIVGGPIQGAKPTGSKINSTTNNLGVVNVTLTTTLGYDLWNDSPFISFETDPNTGTYEVELIPEKFILKDQTFPSTADNEYKFDRPEDVSEIDITNKFNLQYTIDSVFIEASFDHIDTALIYNHNRDWIWRSPQQLSITSENDSTYWGETTWSHKLAENDYIDLPLIEKVKGKFNSYLYNHPVFRQLNSYGLKIKAHELYTNSDDPTKIDIVPVTDGVIIIENQLANANRYEELELDESGKAIHNFKGGMPLVAAPYTKNINFKLKVNDNFIPGAEITESCYVFGIKPSGGMNFVTGADEINFILRDPAGSDSYAYFEKGFTTSETVTDSWSNGFGGDIDVVYMMGVQLTSNAGLGFSVQTQIDSDNSIGLSTSNEFRWNRDRSTTTTKTYQFNYSTSEDPSYVGSSGDVFFGHGTNIFYGAATNVKLLDDDSSTSGYTIGINKAIVIGKNSSTDFVYTQNHIENYLIPNLIEVRNSLFESDEYTSNLLEDDARYGLNNDDPIFDGAEVTITDVEISGPSYTYHPKDKVSDDIYEYNKKIVNWVSKLALNEQLKLSATDKFDDHNNFSNLSFDAGASVESSITVDTTSSSTNTFEWSIDAGVAAEIGFAVNKFGMKTSITERYHHSGGDSSTDEDSNTTTIGFVLADSDQGDYFSIDVKKDTLFDAPVFKLKGGQSACPYEAKEVARYFEPEKEHEISGGTMKVESPEITTKTSMITNVPERLEAVYTIHLSNTSEVGADNWFGVMLDPASNPNGAIVKIDGKALVGGITILVPAGETVDKTLTIKKGRAEINDYNNLNIIMHSLCQFDPTDDVADISDTVSLSANFIASCTDVAITQPMNLWTVNCLNTNADTEKAEMSIKFSDYDLNHSKFESILFQYKPSEQSSWITSKTFIDDADKNITSNDTIKIEGNPSIGFTWDMSSIQNRKYDIRAISTCSDGSTFESEILTGIFDNKRPELFGTPQPADGVLSANDEIMLAFDEDIQAGLITKNNISVTGIQNNTDLRDFDFLQHNASIHFDGVAQNVTIAQNINLKYSPFTFEFWAKRERLGKECIIAHGDPLNGGLWIGFDAENHFSMTINGQNISTTESFSKTDIYNHYACVFNNYNTSGQIEISLVVASGDETALATKTISKNYFKNAPLSVGYCSSDNSAFKGNIHDLRIWNQSSTSSEVQARRYTILNGYEKGLIGAWTMDDMQGNLAKDIAFSRHGQVNATWHTNSKGSAVSLNGGYAVFNASQLELSNDADFTIEFWFKSNRPASDEYIFSNGKADGTDNSKLKWAIVATAENTIKILNDGKEFSIDGNKYLDNNWHHIAVSINRRGNMNIYMDGVNKISNSSVDITGMGGAKCIIGARYWLNVTDEQFDSYFNGEIDEVRIWNGARTKDLILKNMHHSLRGNEFGLKAYFPFEDVTITDPSLSTRTLNNMTLDKNGIAGECSLKNTADYTNETPAIKLTRPVSAIPFSFTTNGNRILISPTIDESRIENTTLDIAIKGIYDLNGNRMKSTTSWSAFVDKNQLVWEKQLINISTSSESDIEFKSIIYNHSGEIEYWQIENMPVWLTADMEQGTLDPLSSQEIIFTVNSAVNIGQYNHDIYLNGSMDFNERCTINLSVKDQEPDWNVNEANYETSMTLIGNLKIAGELSTDQTDMVAAFIGNQCRGVAKLEHFPDQDFYLINLTIHGEAGETDAVNLKVWDASKGNLYTNISTSTSLQQKFNLAFKPNDIIGYASSPTMIETTDSIGVEIPVEAGWNWLSFNLASHQLDSTNLLMSGVQSATNDEIKLKENLNGEGMYDEYVTPYGWDGGFTGKSFEVSKMYKLKNSFADTIQLSGVPVLTSAYPITITKDWNWIGYTPQYKMPVKSAMAYHSPSQNDLVKSQSKFAMYDNTLGWIGSLNYMEPNAGYMYYSNNTERLSFVYPQETLFTKKSATINNDDSNTLYESVSSFEYNMSAVIEVYNNPIEDVHNSKLLAITNGKIVGHTLPVNTGGRYIYPLTISGQTEDKVLSFHLVTLNSETTFTADEETIYHPNKILGSVNNPYIISFQESNMGDKKVVVSPNPFNGVTKISNISDDIYKVVIFDIKGQIIKQWANIEMNEIIWDGTSHSNNNVPSGIYLIKLYGVNNYQQVKVIKLRD